MMIFLSLPSSKVVFLKGGIGWKFLIYPGLPIKEAEAEDERVMPDATIHTLGRILEPRGPVLYLVSLPNGKNLLAHLSKPLADAGASFNVDESVLLEMTPFDFDTARILGRHNESP
jgi:translation initiation factor IF-1